MFLTMRIIGAYVINNKKLTQLWITDQRFLGALCENNIISSYSAMGSGGGTALYQYKSGNSLELVDMVSFDYSSGNKVMYHNQDVVSEADADAILAQYKNMKFEAKPLKILAQSEPKIETTTLAAQKETYSFYGVVSTDSGTLNLRDKPSIDSNILSQLEKGTTGSIYKIDGNSEWYKIVTDNGLEGYVSSQYIKEYDHSSDNSSSTSFGKQTPWGTFTYASDFTQRSDEIIYDPNNIGINLNMDIESFNNSHDDFRIDQVAFKPFRKDYHNYGPHEYDCDVIFMGTALNNIRKKYYFYVSIIDDSTGDKISTNSLLSIPNNLNSGETFCIRLGHINSLNGLCDNSSYTLKFSGGY